MRQLNGQEIQTVRKAIQQSFGFAKFPMFLKERLNKELYNYTTQFVDYEIQVFNLVYAANQEGWHGHLISALLAERPQLKDLYKLAYDFGLTASIIETENGQAENGLERLLDASPFLHVNLLIEKITEIKNKVCRIEVGLESGKKEWGTGFLVGPDLLMTNYHVIKKAIDQSNFENIICLFDFTLTSNGEDVNTGTVIKLSKQENPVIACSKYSSMDLEGGELTESWPTDHLDYVLLKLEKEVGKLPIGPFADGENVTSTEERGWIIKPEMEPAFLNGSHMIIMQHPNKRPLQVVFGFEKVIGMDPNKARVRYKINTEKGSSGSPCFNHKFELVALHNMGDPSWNATYNQGIPIWSIINDLESKSISLGE